MAKLDDLKIPSINDMSPDEAIETFSQIVTLNSYGAITALEKSNSIVITESTTVIRMLLNFKQHVDAPPNNVIHEFVINLFNHRFHDIFNIREIHNPFKVLM